MEILDCDDLPDYFVDEPHPSSVVIWIILPLTFEVYQDSFV
jgi:hypothetical protein